MHYEIYDIFNEQEEKIGTANWEECHTKGLLHAVASVLVFKDTLKQEVLVQRRSATVLQEPGLLQHSAGGHIISGDTPLEGARKEMQEELFEDHALPHIDLHFITQFMNHDMPNNFEFFYVFEAIYPGPFFYSKKELAEPPHWVPWDNLIRDMHAHPERYSRSFIHMLAAYRASTGR